MPSSAETRQPQQRHQQRLTLRFRAALRDQDRGDDEQGPQRTEPDRDIRHQHPEIGDDEGKHEHGADRKAADAAVFGGHQRSPVARCQQPGADREAGKLEQHEQHGIGRGKALRSESAGEAEHDAAGQNDDLGGARRMTPQDSLGDEQGAERDQRGRYHREIVEHAAAAPPRHATDQEQRCDDAERHQQAAGQRAFAITPVQRVHGDGNADRAAQIDDGIGDHA